MGIIVGSARIDENGKISGGQVGDQNGKEVATENFYVHSKGWYIIRPKSVEYATAIASKMKKACSNNNIGYDQTNRYGVIKYGIDTTTKTEADCSSLVRACVKEATGIDSGDFNTSNEKSKLMATGLFDDKGAYVNQNTTPIYDGDILVTKTKGHTVIVVSGNARSASVTTQNGSGSSNSSQTKANTYYKVKAGGKAYAEVKNYNTVNGNGYAGVENAKITDVAMKVDKGSIKYRVHVLGGKWLPFADLYDWNNYSRGFAGNGKVIDGLQIIASGCGGRAKYRVSTVGSQNYLPWVFDTENGNYAGVYGKAIDKIQFVIE